MLQIRVASAPHFISFLLNNFLCVMHACVLVHVEVRGWWVSSSVILHFIFLRQDISLNMELAIWTRLAGQ